MIKTLILVPIQDNEGQPFAPSDWSELERKLLNSFGGYTGGEMVSGAWADSGTVYRDKSREWRVALNSWSQVPEWLELVHWTRTHFRQIAIYMEIAGIPEIVGE